MFSDDIAVWECQDKITDWQQQYCNYHWCNLGTLESWQSWWWWDTVTWSQKITLHPVQRANISNIIKSQQMLIQKQCYIVTSTCTGISCKFLYFLPGERTESRSYKIMFLLGSCRNWIYCMKGRGGSTGSVLHFCLVRSYCFIFVGRIGCVDVWCAMCTMQYNIIV